MMTKRIRDVLHSRSASTWLQSAILSAMDRDCNDAAADAAVLYDLLAERRDRILSIHEQAAQAVREQIRAGGSPSTLQPKA